MAKLRLDELIAQHSLKWTKLRRTLVKFMPYDESLDAQPTTHADTIPFINAIDCLATRSGRRP